MRLLLVLISLASCSLVQSQHQSSGNIKASHPYNFANGQRTRRLQGPSDHKRVSYPQYHGSRQSSNMRKHPAKKHGVPSYAVQMEPLVQYSQPDPLYTIEKQYISEAKPSDGSNNDLIRSNSGPMVGDVTEAESISRLGHISHGRLRPPTHLSPPPGPPRHHLMPPRPHHDVEFSSYGTYYEGPPEAFEPPEPIIEIIIKESNESLPAPPPLPTPPPPPKRGKEPVQVFYVKYRKDPSGGYGEEDKVIYDPPVPAVTPPNNNEESPEEEQQEEPESAQPEYGPPQEEATHPPPPSTTLKAIVRPDSETFQSHGGVHITFGGPDDHHEEGQEQAQGQGDQGPGYGPPAPVPLDHQQGHGPYGELEQQSAPLPSIAFPSRTHKPHISRSSNVGTSTITKRNPGPFNGPLVQPQPQFQPNFNSQPPSNVQQTPHFPPQEFQPPPVNPSQYATIPNTNYQFQRPQPQAIPQRYTTINNPPPAQPYNTISHSQNNNFQPQNQLPQSQFSPQPQSASRAPARPNSQEQQQLQQQVEQVNRLQQQQQQLQQHLAHHRFQHNQPPFQQVHQNQQPEFQQQSHTQFQQQQSVQPSFPPQVQPQQHFQQQQQFNQQASPPIHQQFPQQQQSHQQSQHQQIHQQSQHQQIHQQSQQQQIHQQNQQQQYRQLPQLQYSTHGPDVTRPADHTVSPNIQNHRQLPLTYAPTPRPLPTTRSASTTQQFYRSPPTSTTTPEPVTEIVTEDPKKKEKDKKRKEEQVKKNIANLPDEVPEDLREQLLSSGILSNADIQILDYDKIGDIPIESLPPEALANFQQAAGSQRVQVVTKPDSIEDRDDQDSASSSSEHSSVAVKASQDGDMEMKVVRFNPDEGRGVADRYMKKGATQLAPVVLNDNKYNRYLPLQVSGAQFPVPDIPELRGRNVTSVVVLAPVDYEFLNRRDEADDSEGRVGRSASPVLEVQGVRFVAGDVLKSLVRMPSTENYKRWLDKENMTAAEKQSVVLLVVGPGGGHPDKEIYMYDIGSARVSKLRGELSSTFVKVAESNSHNQDLEEISDARGDEFTIRNPSNAVSRSSR